MHSSSRPTATIQSEPSFHLRLVGTVNAPCSKGLGAHQAAAAVQEVPLERAPERVEAGAVALVPQYHFELPRSRERTQGLGLIVSSVHYGSASAAFKHIKPWCLTVRIS